MFADKLYKPENSFATQRKDSVSNGGFRMCKINSLHVLRFENTKQYSLVHMHTFEQF